MGRCRELSTDAHTTMMPTEMMKDPEGMKDPEDTNTERKDTSCLKRLKSIIFKEADEAELLANTEKVLELLQPVRYKPNSVEEISRETKFTKSEVKFLYRSFKQECPNGIINEERFKEIYENIHTLSSILLTEKILEESPLETLWSSCLSCQKARQRKRFLTVSSSLTLTGMAVSLKRKWLRYQNQSPA